MKRVTMNLTDEDIRNTETLVERLKLRNKTLTVSSALAITEGLTRKIESGDELLLKKKDGSIQTVVIAGLGA